MPRTAQLTATLTALAAAGALAVSSPAIGAPRCGSHAGAGKAMFTTGQNPDMVASCQSTGVCLVTAGGRDKTGAVAIAIVFARTGTTAMRFWSLSEKVDASKGISLALGHSRPVTLPPRVLADSAGPGIVRFTAGLAEKLRPALASASQSTWAITTMTGTRRTYTVSHTGLKDALTWINCAAATAQ